MRSPKDFAVVLDTKPGRVVDSSRVTGSRRIGTRDVTDGGEEPTE